MRPKFIDQVPAETIEWLLGDENPYVAACTRSELLGEGESETVRELLARRNDYAPVQAILEAQHEDGSWDVPSRDYQKYRGSLWQIHLLGELGASREDERVRRGAEYAFSRQLEDGSWSATNMRSAGSIPCLTANVGRALAKMGWAEDERVVAALGYCVDLRRQLDTIDCRTGPESHLNGYCHMLTPKLLLFLHEVPQALWPAGATELRDECIGKLREKQVFHCLPQEFAEFNEAYWAAPARDRGRVKAEFLAEHLELHYKAKSGWLRFGYPLSYNSDVLEAMYALALWGEPVREEYEEALEAVRGAADAQWRWPLKTTLNGKMFADVEKKGRPSKWLTLRGLEVLAHFFASETPGTREE